MAYLSGDFDLPLSLNLHHQESWSLDFQILQGLHLLLGSLACRLQVVDFKGFIPVQVKFLFLSINSLTYLDLAHAQLCCVCVCVAYIFITHSMFLKNLNYQFIHLGR